MPAPARRDGVEPVEDQVPLHAGACPLQRAVGRRDTRLDTSGVWMAGRDSYRHACGRPRLEPNEDVVTGI